MKFGIEKIESENFPGVWPLSANWCIIYVSSDVFLCSVSIVHMTTISFDRYLGISKPLEARYAWNSTLSLSLKVAGVWLVTILISCPIAILALIDVENIFRNGACQIFNRYFQIYGSIVCFFLPFAVNAFTYARTVTKLKEQQESLNAQNGNCGLRRTTKTASIRNKHQQSEDSEDHHDPDDPTQPHLQPLMRMQIYQRGVLRLYGKDFTKKK